ncbi:MobF family relaxase [Isoptericola nanjingensis]|uniref:MobF family relaxase n=1 Tax=Isoptericola nanjingensis TaxID=903413 RepID=UPI003D1BA9BB
MTVSVRKMSAGNGYEYLTRSIRNADLDAAPVVGAAAGSWVDPVAAYYAEAGTPPGFWLGAGVLDLGGGRALRPDDPVTTTHLRRLLGEGVDPVTGKRLGRRYPRFVPVQERIAARVAHLAADLSGEARQTAVGTITAEEVRAGDRTATAGFDLTFSVPKSVSVVWGLADRRTQGLILAAHHRAVAETVGFIERQVAATRVGADAGDGSVAQVDVTGLVAMGFDHWDSRAHDPQLHTHVVVANKVRAVVDGKWRTLDSRALFNANVAFSESYNAVLADRLTGTLGVTWSRRVRGRDRSPALEIDGVPDGLIREFSSRSVEIEHCADDLIREYRREHGRHPSRRTIVRLRALATLATRPPKTLKSLGELTQRWHERASHVLGRDSRTWSQALISSVVDSLGAGRSYTAGEVPDDAISSAAGVVLSVVGEKRATWRHWSLWAEAERQTNAWRFQTAQDRINVVGRIVAAAEAGSVRLTPPELAPTPAFLRRADGTSSLRPRHATVYTSEAVIAAEERLLASSADTTGPGVTGVLSRFVADDAVAQGVVSRPQADAAVSVATSGRVLDVLVGPAGTGKTRTMRLLRTMWENTYGTGSVVGLAPSAAAAQVLAADLRIGCENTAKWLYDHAAGTTAFRSGQLVIVDEASLAGTQTLDRLARHAAAVGAKMLLVGDPAQLSPVETGGAFNLLVGERRRTTGDVPELVKVHRFAHDWEKSASLRLRDGDADVLPVYERHGRITAGTTDEVVEAAYTAWRADQASGKTSILIAADNTTVTELNRRARAERLLAGTIDDRRAVLLAGDLEASAGDTILTRRNDRHLRYGRGGWVRNGTRWQVLHVHRDGSITAQGVDAGRGTDADSPRSASPRLLTVRLPAAYVAEHVDLGYATTVHRAEGITTDTAHLIATPSMTRELAYVGMTRGRVTNTVFVPLDHPDREDNHSSLTEKATDDGLSERAHARAILAGILSRTGAELSAHESMQAERDQHLSIARLAAEYDTIANHVQRPRWARLVTHSLRDQGLDEIVITRALESETFGPLCAELRRAEADGHDVDRLLPRLAANRSLHDADDIVAVLHHRLAAATARPKSSKPARIAGLVPEARGPLSDEASDALTTRARLIARRARRLATQALHDRAPWTRRLPQPLGNDSQWRDLVVAVAAYRDRYGIASNQPLGSSPTSLSQREDARRFATRLRPVVSRFRREPPEARRLGVRSPSF